MKLGAPLTVSAQPSVASRIDACEKAGFDCVQVNLSAAPSSETGDVLNRCMQAGLEIVAIGCYGNPLQPSARSGPGGEGVCAEDVFALLDYLPPRDQPWNIVVWSGTLSGQQVTTPHPGNTSPGAARELNFFARRASAAFSAKNARLLFKPHNAHVLNTAEACADFFGELNNPRVGVVIDVCNFLTPRNFHEREKNIVDTIKLLAPYAGLATLKDARIENFAVGYTSPGQGQVGYAGLLRELQRRCRNVPWLIECPESETQLRHARAYVELQARLANVT
jgi:sugar phosphate isomerase/epimerase